MKHFRTATRRNLDKRLERIRGQLEDRPPVGWIRTIREALGMSTYELAKRLDLSSTRVRQFESAELEGSIRLSTLNRVAHALNSRCFYLFIPNEPLEDMVHAQAERKAAARLSISDPDVLKNEAHELSELRWLQALEDLTIELVDRQGLWR